MVTLQLACDHGTRCASLNPNHLRRSQLCCHAGDADVVSSEFKLGEVVRFLMIFELVSDQDPNYKHIHTLKGVGQHTLGPWTQYEPVYCVPATEQNPCSFNEDSIRALNVRILTLRPCACCFWFGAPTSTGWALCLGVASVVHGLDRATTVHVLPGHHPLLCAGPISWPHPFFAASRCKESATAYAEVTASSGSVSAGLRCGWATTWLSPSPCSWLQGMAMRR